MKKFILSTILGITGLVKSQIVNIPDTNFKAYLVSNPQINTNNDNEIQISEAAVFAGSIDIYNKGINNIAGLEFFVNLTKLQCASNNIYNLDISKNINLKELYCGNNQLTSLDVSKNIFLTSLWCGGNKLTNLDVSKNSELVNLYCEYNNITNLDLSKNNALAGLSCGGNQFTILDLGQNSRFSWLSCNNNPFLTNLNLKNGNNTKLSSIYIVENPRLTCVQVDDVNYANAQPAYLWHKDATASYSSSCALSTTEFEKPQTKIYPNPVKDILNFSEDVSNIIILDISGKIVKQISTAEKAINLAELSKGTYIISATTKTGEAINKKFIKE